jgi:hypothetical protein
MISSRKANIAKIVFLSLLLSVFSGISATSAQTMKTCVDKKSGVMRLITKGACKSSEKKVTWSIKGDAGLPGPKGDAGLPGPSGASTSVIWFSPRDLLASRNGVVDGSGIADTSSVSSLTLTNNAFHAEALDLAQEKAKVVFRAVPKGWSKATSLTVRVFWLLTEESTAPVSFEVYLNSRGAGDDFGSTDWGTSASEDQSGALVVSKGLKIMNTHSFTWSSSERISDGELLTLSLYREGNLQKPSVYSGKVYVMGVSIEANFPE